MFLGVPVGNAGTLCLLVVAANLLRGFFCGVERISGVGTGLALPKAGIASFSGSVCGVDTTAAGVSEVTGSSSGCGIATTGGSEVGKGLEITRRRAGEVGTTGTGEVWEETDGSLDAGVGKDSGDGVGLVAIVVSGCC